MKRILVTGGSGFIGRHVVPLLEQWGYEVHAPSHSEMDVLNQASVTNALKTIQPSSLLHLAWIATPGVYQESPENERWKDASMHLFREAIRCGTTNIVAAGSCFEYAWPETPCIEDDTPTNASTFYGRCKNACREELMTLAKQEQITAAWGRIFFLYGPGEPAKKLIASVIQSLLKGEVANCTHGNQVRDFLYVKDVAAAFVALLESSLSGTFNIASGEPITLKHLIETAAAIVGKPDLVYFGAREAPPNEAPVIAADTRKLTKNVGWTPAYTHDAALRETVDWWKTQA